MNEDELRAALARAAQPGGDDEVRAMSAVYLGRRLHRRRSALVGAGTLVTVVATGLAVREVRERPAPVHLVLDCTGGTAGTRVVDAGLTGVTLTVDNPTTAPAVVAARGTSALALPGRTQVTLPLVSGDSVRCGSGAPLTVTLRHASGGRCSTAPGAGTVVAASPLDETRAVLGAAAADAVATESGAESLRRVQLTRQGRVVAEALWHALPSDTSWLLESLSTCEG